MYQNKVGVVGVGDVQAPWSGNAVAKPVYYTGLGHLKDGEHEYQISVRWWADLRTHPVTSRELSARGIQVTPHAVRTIGTGTEDAERLVQELRAREKAPRQPGESWTESSFFLEAIRLSPTAVPGLRHLLDQALARGGALRIHWGSGDHLARFMIRQSERSEDLISCWAAGRINVQTRTLEEMIGEQEPLRELSTALGGPSWLDGNEPPFDATELARPEVAVSIGRLLDRIATPRVAKPSYWALFANPDRYRIDDAVHNLREDTWTTAGYEMRRGDRVVVWRGQARGAGRGVVALGEIISDPVEIDDSANPYWVTPPASGEVEPRVRVRYVVPARLPLLLEDDRELLGQLSVSRARGGTVFRVTRAQWESLVHAAGGWSDSALQPLLVGVAYRAADETATSIPREAVDVDPDKVDRGCQAHAKAQNALAKFLRDRGLEPRSPAPGEPGFDLAWSDKGTIYVAEVKSITETNQEKQLRLGLGQVLRYRQALLAEAQQVIAVLVPEGKPTDETWVSLCDGLGVLLAWPEGFEALPALSATA